MRNRGVVLALEEIVARRLAAREAGRGVEAAVTNADFRLEERPANWIDRHIAVVVKVGRAKLVVGVETPRTGVPSELCERVRFALRAVVVVVAPVANQIACVLAA